VPAALGIEEAEVVLHKGYEPDFVADLFDADLLAGKECAKYLRHALVRLNSCGRNHYTWRTFMHFICRNREVKSVQFKQELCQ